VEADAKAYSELAAAYGGFNRERLRKVAENHLATYQLVGVGVLGVGWGWGGALVGVGGWGWAGWGGEVSGGEGVSYGMSSLMKQRAR